jgi:1-deoxy-D-xylulose 5-phosphate reductoisomerase
MLSYKSPTTENTAVIHTNWQKMQTLCKKFQPKFVVMMDKSAAKALSKVVSDNIEVLQGVEALNTIATLGFYLVQICHFVSIEKLLNVQSPQE